MKQPKIHLQEWLDIPIYDARVLLVVADEPLAVRKKHDDLWGPAPDSNFNGLVAYGPGCAFGIFFSTGAHTCDQVVGHEVFHLTHRILDWAGVKFDKSNHEAGALLHGYLLKLIMKKLSKV